MKKIRSFASITLLILFPAFLHAQQFDEGFFRENLLKTSYAIDTSAAAVVLYEKFEANIVERGYHNESRYDDIYHVHKIIKILKPEAIALAKVHFSYYYHSDKYEGYINDVKATTYNISNRQVTAAQMESESIVTNGPDSNHHVEMSFRLPDVRVGSIIEYSYSVSKDMTYDLPDWQIQDAYPKLITEFQLTSINTLIFNEIIQGKVQFTNCKNKKRSRKSSSNDV